MTKERRVDEIMTSEAVAIHARDKVAEAARRMELGAFRHLPVIDDAGQLLGIVSQRDILRAKDDAVPVATVMSVDVKTVRPETAAHEAAYMLLRHRIGCVPVVDGRGVVVGILTESDFVRIAYGALGGRVAVEELEAEEIEAERSA